jgi:bacterioferritin
MHANFESTLFGALMAEREQPRLPAEREAPPLVTGPADGADWREQVVRLLKDSLIKELVCVVRYNHLSADTCMQPLLSAEFLLHSHEELAHAYKLAQHIVEFGGELEYSPHLLMRMGRATHDYHQDLKSMITANLNSQYRIIVKYMDIISKIDTEDVYARRLLAEIVKEERDHAEELSGWLTH